MASTAQQGERRLDSDAKDVGKDEQGEEMVRTSLVCRKTVHKNSKKACADLDMKWNKYADMALHHENQRHGYN